MTDKQVLCSYRLKEAEETLADAEKMLKEGFSPRSIVNRAYYSAFYATLDLFLHANINIKTSKQDDQYRENFLNTLQHVIKRYNWICHAYCLMTNHYHLLIETPEGNLSLGMRQLNGVYTQPFNRLHGKIGHLFHGRYKAILIQSCDHPTTC